MKVYLASDLGFSEPGRHYLYSELIPFIEKSGITVIDPWKLTDQSIIDEAAECIDLSEKIIRWRKVNAVIAKNNADAIRSCDALAAVIDGSDADSGVSAEIGFAAALGKTVWGLRSDFRLASDNEGSIVNLQVEYFIMMSGGRIERTLEALVAGLLRK